MQQSYNYPISLWPNYRLITKFVSSFDRSYSLRQSLLTAVKLLFTCPKRSSN